jgi:hypothetical protein
MFERGAEGDGRCKTRTLKNEGCGTRLPARSDLVGGLRWLPAALDSSVIARV